MARDVRVAVRLAKCAVSLNNHQDSDTMDIEETTEGKRETTYR